MTNDAATLPATPTPEATADDRVNLGASPGDGFHAEPYLYVGPWGPHRPGAPGFWNAPFGAVLGWGLERPTRDVVDTGVTVLRRLRRHHHSEMGAGAVGTDT